MMIIGREGPAFGSSQIIRPIGQLAKPAKLPAMVGWASASMAGAISPGKTADRASMPPMITVPARSAASTMPQTRSIFSTTIRNPKQ